MRSVQCVDREDSPRSTPSRDGGGRGAGIDCGGRAYRIVDLERRGLDQRSVARIAAYGLVCSWCVDCYLFGGLGMDKSHPKNMPPPSYRSVAASLQYPTRLRRNCN